MKTVSSIERSLEYSQQETDDVKPLQIKLSKEEQTMGQLNDDLKEQQVKAKYLENQSSRNNLWINCKSDVDVEIDRAHHVE